MVRSSPPMRPVLPHHSGHAHTAARMDRHTHMPKHSPQDTHIQFDLLVPAQLRDKVGKESGDARDCQLTRFTVTSPTAGLGEAATKVREGRAIAAKALPTPVAFSAEDRKQYIQNMEAGSPTYSFVHIHPTPRDGLVGGGYCGMRCVSHPCPYHTGGTRHTSRRTQTGRSTTLARCWPVGPCPEACALPAAARSYRQRSPGSALTLIFTVTSVRTSPSCGLRSRVRWENARRLRQPQLRRRTQQGRPSRPGSRSTRRTQQSAGSW